MEDLYIDIRNENEVIRKVFDNKHLVSLDELLNTIEDLKLEIEYLQEQLEDIEQDIQDNYKRITTEEQLGYSESW